MRAELDALPRAVAAPVAAAMAGLRHAGKRFGGTVALDDA